MRVALVPPLEDMTGEKRRTHSQTACCIPSSVIAFLLNAVARHKPCNRLLLKTGSPGLSIGLFLSAVLRRARCGVYAPPNLVVGVDLLEVLDSLAEPGHMVSDLSATSLKMLA